MTQQALFYEQATPIVKDRHSGWHIGSDGGYAFSRNTNSVPVMGVEFANAAREYPIVFVRQADVVLPVVILGLNDRENLFIDDSGNWDGSYIPAYVRRYPFIFATADDGKTFTVCIDESFAGFNEEGNGEPLQ